MEVGESVAVPTPTPPSDSECEQEGHPVDVASGRVMLSRRDWSFPTPVSLDVTRTYSSQRAAVSGQMGRGWSLSLEMSIILNNQALVFQDSEGKIIDFPRTNRNPMRMIREGLVIAVGDGRISMSTRNGFTYEFIPDSLNFRYVLKRISNLHHGTIEFNHERNRISACKDAAGNRYEFERNSIGNLIAVHLHTGSGYLRLRAYEYEGSRLVRVFDELGHVETYEYDEHDRIVRETNRNGYSFYFTYDSLGRCMHTWGDGGFYERRFRFQPDRRLTEVTDSTGAVTLYQANRAGLIERVTDPLGSVWKRHYDDEFNLIEAIDPAGAGTVYEYDSEGLLVRELDPTGVAQATPAPQPLMTAGSSQIRGPRGELLELVRFDNQRLAFEYDLALRLSACRDANGHVTRYRHDAEGNLSAIERPSGSTTAYTYNAHNLLSRRVDALSNVVTYRYDREARPVECVNSNSESHRFEYNELGQLTQEHSFENATRRYTYSPAGYLMDVLYEDHSILRHERDTAGRILSFYSDKEGTLASFEYDDRGRLVRAYNPSSNVCFEYDENGRIVKDVQNDRFVSYLYDDNDRIVSLTIGTTKPRVVEYDYNSLGALNSVRLPYDRDIEWEYDHSARPIRRHLPNGLLSECRHDRVGNLLHQVLRSSDAILCKREYEYDSEDRLIRRLDSYEGATRFEYDAAGRLIFESNLWSAEYSFILDRNGNPLAISEASADVARGDRLTRLGDQTFRYDARGRLIEKQGPQGTMRFEYDLFGQLIRCNLEDGRTVEYTYDALGRRLSKQVDGEAPCEFLWGLSNMIVERVGEHETVHVYHPQHPIALARLDGERAYFAQTDHRGAPHEYSDNNGNLAWRGRYQAYGRCRVDAEVSIENQLRLQGQYHDSETGLHYSLYRYYDPDVGRYLTPDPISFAGGDINLYRYALGDPVNRMDPMGLEPISTGLSTGWGIALAEPTPIGEIVMSVVTGLVVIGSLVFMASREKGHSWVTDLVRAEAQRTGRDPCDILREMYNKECDKKKKLEIKKAQKFLKCRPSRGD